MFSTLKDRMDFYQNTSANKYLPKIPLIININGKGFEKATQNLDKPFSSLLHQLLCMVGIKLVKEIEGSLISYVANDEITILSRNDSDYLWHENDIQKITTYLSSFASVEFYKLANEYDLNMSEGIFCSKAFNIPSQEIINFFIYKQQQNFFRSSYYACYYLLLDKYDHSTVRSMLSNLSTDERLDLLKKETNIDYEDLSDKFRKGSLIYRVPTFVNHNLKNKWNINDNVPIFTEDQKLFNNIIQNGADILRKEYL